MHAPAILNYETIFIVIELLCAGFSPMYFGVVYRWNNIFKQSAQYSNNNNNLFQT